MNAEIAETVKARKLGLGTKSLEVLRQKEIVDGLDYELQLCLSTYSSVARIKLSEGREEWLPIQFLYCT